MRNHYIVAYDISDDKRLREVYRTMQGYGDRLQYSVFICELSAKERVMLVTALEELIDQSEDCIMFIDMGSGDCDKRIKFLGRHIDLPTRQATVV
jgi:CRISPR-associated protein Cas2